ncbi:putative formamidase [Microsporum canis]
MFLLRGSLSIYFNGERGSLRRLGVGEIRIVIWVDRKEPVSERPGVHTGWYLHQVPVCGGITNGETGNIECLGGTGGQIKDSDGADDIHDVNLVHIHYLSQPFDVETAVPADVLVGEIQDKPRGLHGHLCSRERRISA